MCVFPFCSGKSVGSVGESVGRVCGVGYGIFVSTGIESICDVLPLLVFLPRVDESKCGQIIELFLRPKY